MGFMRNKWKIILIDVVDKITLLMRSNIEKMKDGINKALNR